MILHSLHRLFLVGFLGIGLLAMGTGCASERHLSTGISGGESAPDWVLAGAQEPTETLMFVVGRGVGVNVVDERAAFDAAMAHAAEQVARMVANQVAVRLESSEDRGPGVHGLRRGGDDWHPKNKSFAAKYPGVIQDRSRLEAEHLSAVVVSHLIPVETYWERWRLRERPFLRLWWNTRYKCWVLVQVEREKIDQLAEEMTSQLSQPTGRSILTVVGR